VIDDQEGHSVITYDPTCSIDKALMGERMHRLIAELYPICRSLTGNGVRQTLRILNDLIPLKIHEVPTGTPVFDWTVPQEWNIADGYIKNSRGERVVDFQRSNLHVMGYSVPIKKVMSLGQLRPHLASIPDQPDWIPQRSLYFKRDWGFCLTHTQLMALEEGDYEVCIESSLVDGHLTYGECLLPGELTDEILLSTHICHPSLCNDNLSGIAISAYLAKFLSTRKHRYSYRFLFIPTTVGAITWLSKNESHLQCVKHGLVMTCLGDAGKITYKKTRRGNTEIDRAALHVLRHSGDKYDLLEFSPIGYDERQYCSPAFDLAVGCFMRTPNGKFPEYHTSGDNLAFVKAEYLGDSLSKLVAILLLLENNAVYINQIQKGEPCLGKRGLYRAYGSEEHLAISWVLNLSDGSHSLLDIADRSGISFEHIRMAADALLAAHLIDPTSSDQITK
jgi:aminopeptidase-like protein